MYLGHSVDLLISLLQSAIVLLVMKVQGIHVGYKKIKNNSTRKAMFPYPLLDATVIAVAGIIYIILTFYLGPKYPSAQWVAYFFVYGVWLLVWVGIIMLLKRYADKLLSRYVSEINQ